MKPLRPPPSPATERAVEKLVEKEFKLERELRELVKKKRMLYRQDQENQNSSFRRLRFLKTQEGEC